MLNIKKIYNNISFLDKNYINELFNNFSKDFDIDFIFFKKNSSHTISSTHINSDDISIIKNINIEKIVLDYIYEKNNIFFKNLKNKRKYILIKEININILNRKNYIYYFFDDKNENIINDINIFNFIIEKEINNYFVTKKLNNITYFNEDINDFLIKYALIKNDNDIDSLLEQMLKNICHFYKMTCGYIVELLNNRYYPIITYTASNNNCHYGFYTYEDNTGPWKAIKELLKNSNKNYLYFYELPLEQRKFFKKNNCPKSAFVTILNYKNIHICFSVSNNKQKIFLDEFSLSGLQIIFHLMYELICRKNLYNKNKQIEKNLSLKLDKWIEDTKPIAQKSMDILKDLQRHMKD